MALPEYKWLLGPPSVVAASGSTLVDTKLRKRGHSHHSVLCECVLCVFETSGSRSTRSAIDTDAFRRSTLLEVDGRFAIEKVLRCSIILFISGRGEEDDR